MTTNLTQGRWSWQKVRSYRAWQAWADLSLRTKLLLFALGLVTLPGIAFAFFAFSGARAALEREVGIQLHQTAERGADVVAAALERAQSDARSWASQDVMRELHLSPTTSNRKSRLGVRRRRRRDVAVTMSILRHREPRDRKQGYAHRHPQELRQAAPVDARWIIGAERLQERTGEREEHEQH